jgi:predicted nucleotide-binding protein
LNKSKHLLGAPTREPLYGARQNVLIELGYFTGKLGRNRVCALHRGNIEIPTDYIGVLYLPLDDGGQLRLAKELKAAGFDVDMNSAI